MEMGRRLGLPSSTQALLASRPPPPPPSALRIRFVAMLDGLCGRTKVLVPICWVNGVLGVDTKNPPCDGRVNLEKVRRLGLEPRTKEFLSVYN